MSLLLRKSIISKIVRNLPKAEGISPDKLTSALTVSNNSSGNSIEVQLPLQSLGIVPESLYNESSKIVSSFPTDNTFQGVSLSPPETKYPLLNFRINLEVFSSHLLKSILSKSEEGFINTELPVSETKEKIVVEFSSPNIAKPFHVGHLRSTMHGNFIANLSEVLGHNVTRLNYLGDWGTQFGFLQYGLNQNWVSNEELAANPIAKLLEIYVRANAEAEKDPRIAEEARSLFQRLESEQEPALWSTWSQIKDYTTTELGKMYARLGVHFDEFHWESQYGIKAIRAVLNALETSGHLVKAADGKQVVHLNEKRAVTLVKSDGSSLYLSRDIAAAMDRFQCYKFDRMLYIVDKAQTDHFVSLKAVLAMMPGGHACSERIRHVRFGRIQGMSTRKGTAVMLSDLLDEAHVRMKAKQLASPTTKVDVATSPEVTDRLAVSSVLIHDLKQRRERDYSFRWEDALQDKGDTAVRLHYTHSRLCSLEKNCGIALDLPSQLDEVIEDVMALISTQPPELIQLLRDVACFRQSLHSSYDQLESCILVRYLFDLSHSISQALTTVQIKDQPVKTARARLVCFIASKNVLALGMKILGIQPLNEM